MSAHGQLQATNMINIILILVCFYDALLVLIIPSSATFLLAEDGGCGRMIATLGAMFIGLNVLYKYGFKQIPNLFMPLLIGFIVFSSFHSPNLTFDSVFIPKDSGIFNFKPMFEVLIYLLMFMGIISIPYIQLNKRRIGVILSWIGITYSCYMILQALGMDQIYKLVGTHISELSRNPTNGGFISQPVFAAAVLAICLPFVMLNKAWAVPLVIIAEFLTGNRSGLSAMALSLVYLVTLSKRYVLIVLGAYIAIVGLAMAIYMVHPEFNFHIQTSERLITWKAVCMDILHPSFPGIDKTYILTGLGLGSFSVLFPFYHHSGFHQAHNEYLEVLYTLSFAGLFLFIRMIWDILKTSSSRPVTAALIAIATFAITNPVWHIPQLQFLTVLLIGLVYNKEISYVMGPTRN